MPPCSPGKFAAQWVEVQADFAGGFAGQIDHAQSTGQNVAFLHGLVHHQRSETAGLVGAGHDWRLVALAKLVRLAVVIAIGHDDFFDWLQGVELGPLIVHGRRRVDEDGPTIEPDREAIQFPGHVGIGAAPSENAV